MKLRVVTWNMQVLFPVRSDGKWEYLRDVIRPDVAVLTEAKPGDTGYQLTYKEDGLGKRRRWGTIVASDPALRAVELPQVRYRLRTHDLYGTWPGSVVVVDIFAGTDLLLTVAGVYAVTVDGTGKSVGHGRHTTLAIAEDLAPLFRARKHVLFAGDLNAWPPEVRPRLAELPLVDLIEQTAGSRPPNDNCACQDPKPTAHIWTHANKANPTKEQQVDYLFATPTLADRLTALQGGPADFPDIWEWSDHAPLVAEFEV